MRNRNEVYVGQSGLPVARLQAGGLSSRRLFLCSPSLSGSLVSSSPMAGSDGFWENSDIKGYNFDDDESSGNQMCGFPLGGAARLSEQIKKGITTENDDYLNTLSSSSRVIGGPSIQPDLMDLISEKSLNAILELDSGEYQYLKKDDIKPEEELRILRRQLENRWSPPNISSLLKKIVLGQPYSLELYRSMESKTELLNEAVSLGDGNAILTVVLFLAKSLKKTLFYQLLRSHTEAVNHYVNYLGTRMQLQEMTDILEMVMRGQEASMKQFSIACQSPQKRLQKLKTCLRNHFAESKDKIFVDNFIKLLEWQQSIGTAELEGKSVIDSLAYTCEHHWNDNKSSATSPYMLAQHHRINRRQFQWVALNALAKNSSWNEIETLLVTKGWLGGKRVNAILPMDQVVIQLHKLKAPNNVLHIYFELIDDIDKRMCVAKKLQCHKEVIDILMSQKDRKALLWYKAHLQPQSEDYFYADDVIKTSNIKWKN